MFLFMYELAKHELCGILIKYIRYLTSRVLQKDDRIWMEFIFADFYDLSKVSLFPYSLTCTAQIVTYFTSCICTEEFLPLHMVATPAAQHLQ